MDIRLATSVDTASLIEMGRQMQAESPRFSRFGFSEAKCQALIERLLNGAGVVLVVEKDGQIVGMLGGVVVEHFFSEDKYGADLVVFVAPAHRGGSAFVRLVLEFERWAVEQGACEVLLGVSTEVATDRTVAMYERLGYHRSGCAVIKRLNNV